MFIASGVRIDRRAALRTGALLIAGAAAAPALGVLAACATTEPRAIAYGHDECAYCRMVVSDARFAAALVTAKGRTVAFDSAECLASYYAQERRDRGRDAVHSLWVSDYRHPGQLIPARRARFVRIGGPGSPMGKGLIAFRSDADTHGMTDGSATLGWDEVVALVEGEGPDGALARRLAEALAAAGARKCAPHEADLVVAPVEARVDTRGSVLYVRAGEV
jgi:copper chaperone NosL